MALIQIPIRNDIPAYQMRVDLDGITYRLDFDYNTRTTLWRMSILDDAGNPLVYSIPMLIDFLLTIQFKHINSFPPGDFLLINLKEENVNPDRTTFSEDVVLFYNEANNV